MKRRPRNCRPSAHESARGVEKRSKLSQLVYDKQSDATNPSAVSYPQRQVIPNINWLVGLGAWSRLIAVNNTALRCYNGRSGCHWHIFAGETSFIRRESPASQHRMLCQRLPTPASPVRLPIRYAYVPSSSLLLPAGTRCPLAPPASSFSPPAASSSFALPAAARPLSSSAQSPAPIARPFRAGRVPETQARVRRGPFARGTSCYRRG